MDELRALQRERFEAKKRAEAESKAAKQAKQAEQAKREKQQPACGAGRPTQRPSRLSHLVREYVAT